MRVFVFSLIASLVLLLIAARASAQTTPETEARIVAYVRESNALAAAHAARPRAEPYADLQAQSQRLTAAQRAQAQSIFASAFMIWQAGDMAAARLAFERGLAIDPANGPANFYMGDILAHQYEGNRAHGYYARAIALGANTPEAFRAETALSALGPATGITEAPAVFAPQTPQVTFRDCANCPEMITIPAGVMTYADRRVTVAPFAVGRFEVTFDEWATCARGGGCTSNPNPSDQGWGRGNRPAIDVSWNDAQEYVRWLSQSTGKSYRLLSETEWEFAAGAGTASTYWWGEQRPVCDQNARNGANFDTCTDDRTRPVGSFASAVNAFGLYDVHGNVSEWVEECYPADCLDGRGARGGSWKLGPLFLRLVNRNRLPPAYSDDGIGFRVVRRPPFGPALERRVLDRGKAL